MSTYTYDIYSKGLEQGGWNGSDTTSRSDRVRDTGYTEITTKFVSPKITTTCNTGKTVNINFYGYNSSKSLLCDLYWYNSPVTLDVSSYSGMKYFRIQLKYSDNSNISPSEITSLKVEVEIPDPWYIDNNEKLNHLNLAEEIPGNTFQDPYPSSFWNFISDTDETLTLNDEYLHIMRYAIVDSEQARNDEVMLTYPYPASFWYVREDNKLNMDLLKDAVVDIEHFRNDEIYLTYPYPASFWFYDNRTNLTAMLLKDSIPNGAFMFDSNLIKIKLPRSLTSIGADSFVNTNFTYVEIPNPNCTYYASSFPSNCEVVGGKLIEEFPR